MRKRVEIREIREQGIRIQFMLQGNTDSGMRLISKEERNGRSNDMEDK